MTLNCNKLINFKIMDSDSDDDILDLSNIHLDLKDEKQTRNFDKILLKPHELMIEEAKAANARNKRKNPDVFKKAESIDASLGPINLLKTKLNKQIKVTIRRRKKAPFISRTLNYKGKLVMFDMHLNIFLEDVTESLIYEYDGKTFARARHKNNLMIRGDNIILIANPL